MTMSAFQPSAAPFTLAPRRAYHLDVTDGGADGGDEKLLAALERFDLIYRTLCGILYNYVPTSGHPGGSISSGRIVATLLFNGMDYDFRRPERDDADVLSYAAGHKAMGLYAMWALRNEVVRVARPALLPAADRQLRLEDLLGFRRNPTQKTPLFVEYRAKALDGHPTPATPFVRLATGASGVGVPASIGLALGAIDTYGATQPPRVHILEGEGGMTAGRVSEAMATAATAQLWNAVMHLDWNQASIDSNRVCRDHDGPGDYVQWDPAELAYLHDWNLIRVADGKDFRQVLAAQRLAAERRNDQPTAICYRTVKGWKYGIEGKGSHGAGHKFCSPEFYKFLEEFEQGIGLRFPRFEGDNHPDKVERSFWETMLVLRAAVEQRDEWVETLGGAIAASSERLEAKQRAPRKGAPDLAPIYGDRISPTEIPAELRLVPGSSTTLRGALGDALNYLNRLSGGGILGGAADLLGSTSINNLAKGFPEGFFRGGSNLESRIVACGGICEDSMGAVMAGLSAYGRHIGAGASYGAFIAALQHIAARLHAIGQQARHDLTGEPYRTFLLVCAHAGLKTGEDGPTHADPQALQLLQENFPRGAGITLTPWEPQELWPLVAAGLRHRPAVLAPFVTRPNETVPDRAALKLPPATAAAEGVYALRRVVSGRPRHGAVILQESGVAYGFVQSVLPELDRRKLEMNVYYVASCELFDLLPEARRRAILPEADLQVAMGITGFTLATMYRWIRSDEGLRRTLHPYRGGRYPGSGQAERVLEEAGLDGGHQLQAVLEYAESRASRA
jgi:transketolase